MSKNKDKEVREIVQRIIKRWQGQIDFQKKDVKHYKLYKKSIDEQQKEVNALSCLNEIYKVR